MYFFLNKFEDENYNFVVGDILFLKYYDQFKYFHFMKGKCILKRKLRKKNKNDFYVVIYDKSKGFYFSFFLKSPLIIAIFVKQQ